MTKTWTTTPARPDEGHGLVYSREPGYRVARMGHFWQVWCAGDFLGTAPRLRDGQALTWQHETMQAWDDAHAEQRAREMTDWNLRQARAGASLRGEARLLGIYDREINRRRVLLAERAAAHEAAEKRARTEYTMHSYRAPFSGEIFDHIMAPGTRTSLCGSLYGGPGEPLDLRRIKCLPCMQRYAAIVLEGRS